MPVALTTTKRKFHKILDSISNSSSVSLTSGNEKHNASTTTLPTNVDPPAKKPRITRPLSASVPSSARAAAMPASSVRSLSVTQHPTPPGMNEAREPPHFAPWDRGQFLKRLATYRHVDKWRGKEEKINEVQWAKRGWLCVGKEKVRCVGGCERQVVIVLESSHEDKENADSEQLDQQDKDEDDDDWREKARAQLVDKYAEMITTAHERGCLWQRRGCDDTIYRLPLAHQETAIENLGRRYRSLAAISSKLPSSPSTPENFDLSDIHEQLLDVFRPPSTIPQASATSPDAPGTAEAPFTLDTPALLLALFGWQAEEGHKLGLATCTACFRRLGLWLFKPSDPSKPSTLDRLDVVGEHRDYCPWINPLSQNGVTSRRTSLEGLAGWQVLMRAVQASALHRKYDEERAPAAVPQNAVEKETAGDAASEVGTSISLAPTKEDRKDQDEKDKERWAKLKRLKSVFHVKRRGKDQKTGGTDI